MENRDIKAIDKEIFDDRPRLLCMWREEFKDYQEVTINDIGKGIEF